MENQKHNYNYNNNDWRKQKEDNFRHFNKKSGGFRPRSHNNRRSSFGGQLSSWEKKFCATAGVPWQKVLETQKYMSEDEKVLKWNDTAGKEAFWNAKNRFWAQMHGQPCDIKMPDPDIFIDKIDWESSYIDPDLISDLDNREPDIPENQVGGVVVGIPVVPEQNTVVPTGWGDAEDCWDPQPKNCERRDSSGYDNWDYNGVNKQDDGYTFEARNRADNGYDDKQQWNRIHSKNSFDHRDTGWNSSRFKISRYHSNDHNNSRSGLLDFGNKRGDVAYGQPWIKWRPVTRRW